ncbi:MAG: hypothetical protein R2867_10700 [Caldilineaceae bacterium]
MLYGVQMRMHLLTADLADEVPPTIQENLLESTKLLADAINAALAFCRPGPADIKG